MHDGTSSKSLQFSVYSHAFNVPTCLSRMQLTERFMQQALALAEMSVGLSDPNPRVGCIIIDRHGQVIGQGHTQEAGGAHAEIMALRDAQARGLAVQGGTAYVTLEPCAHHGRTPPCCDALIHAGLQGVVVALEDPNPLVAGQGLARMRSAGLHVDTIPAGPLQQAARELNIGFFSRMQRQRPWVRLKAALSMDGRTALHNRQSRWITGAAARADGHHWRKRAGAILTGSGTVLADDPQLNVRLIFTHRHPLRAVIDSKLQIPPAAQIFQDGGPVVVYTSTHHPEKIQKLEEIGVEVKPLPPHSGESSHINLSDLLADLAKRGVNELHVEAGESLNGALIAGGWVDEYLIYMAPPFVGPRTGFCSIGAFYPFM